MTRLLFALAVLLAAVASAPAAARAHEVETLDGTVHEGKIVVEDDEVVIIVTTFHGRVSIPRADVKRVDRLTPPLRDQLANRAEHAKDSVEELLKLHKWAKDKGFAAELVQILERILALDPGHARAHRLLGHEKVDGVWMTPEEKEAHLRVLEEQAMRAQGLVPYQGRWVTPEEKDALERGLVRDGDEWVTEEEYHLRRGEQRVDGAWIRIGEAEGKAWLEELQKGRTQVQYRWGPGVDLYTDTEEDVTAEVQKGVEAVFRGFRALLKPAPAEYPEGVDGRVRVHVFAKQPAYARFALWFDGQEKCEELIAGWARAAQRQHAFWWVQPLGVVGAYRFPNTTRTVTSNAAHNMAFILLTRYRFNYRFPAPWLLEGFAYHLEMEAYGYSDTFNLHRAGTVAAQGGGVTAWADSARWRTALKELVAQGQDPPLKRIALMSTEQLGYPELVKSWSVVEFLVRRDRVKFKAFLDAGKDRERTQEEALTEALGWTWRELDQAWRDYVTADFQLP